MGISSPLLFAEQGCEHAAFVLPVCFDSFHKNPPWFPFCTFRREIKEKKPKKMNFVSICNQKPHFFCDFGVFAIENNRKLVKIL
jgi:hypothetical protein